MRTPAGGRGWEGYVLPLRCAIMLLTRTDSEETHTLRLVIIHSAFSHV